MELELISINIIMSSCLEILGTLSLYITEAVVNLESYGWPRQGQKFSSEIHEAMQDIKG
jgi:hypothetical protein